MFNQCQRKNWHISTIFSPILGDKSGSVLYTLPEFPSDIESWFSMGENNLVKHSLLGYFLFLSHSSKGVSWDQLWNKWPVVEYLSQGLHLGEPKPRVCCISGPMEILSLVFHGGRSCWDSSCLSWHVGEPLLFESEEECTECVLLLS